MIAPHRHVEEVAAGTECGSVREAAIVPLFAELEGNPEVTFDNDLIVDKPS